MISTARSLPRPVTISFGQTISWSVRIHAVGDDSKSRMIKPSYFSKGGCRSKTRGEGRRIFVYTLPHDREGTILRPPVLLGLPLYSPPVVKSLTPGSTESEGTLAESPYMEHGICNPIWNGIKFAYLDSKHPPCL